MKRIPGLAFLAYLCLSSGCLVYSRAPLPPETAVPTGQFQIPLANADVLSHFGRRGRRFHTGIDLRAHRGGGDPVLAAREGKVTRVQRMSGYGNLIEIRHADGFSSRYAHLKKIQVKVGQKVSALQPIGLVGATGRASTAHLHFEILTPAYRFCDPAPLLFP